MLIVFAILAVTIALFLSDRFRLDLIALLAVLGLILSGVLTTDEALAGFSNDTVLIIAGLFVVGGGLLRTGVADAIRSKLSQVAGTSETRLLVALMLTVAVLSAFMSSTGTTAIFLPVAVSLAWSAKISPSRLLIPMAFASLIGGMLTLIGTPPNIVVSSYLAEQGLEPFGFFSFTPVGLVMLAITVVFMAFLGRRLLVDRAPSSSPTAQDEDAPTLDELAASYGLTDNVYRLRVRRNSPLEGKTLAEIDLPGRYDVQVLEIQSWPSDLDLPTEPRPVEPDTAIEAHDILRVEGRIEDVTRLAREQSLGIRPPEELGGRFISKELGLVEVIITPRSRLVGRTLSEARFRDKYHVTVLAIMRRGSAIQSDLRDTKLRFGDTMLVQGTWDKISLLTNERRNFLVVGQPREMLEARHATNKAPYAIAIMLGMMLLMTFQVLPAVTAVLLAAVAMVLVGCLSMEDAYASMNWESIILIAAMLPMATALEKTGGVTAISTVLIDNLGGRGPLVLMAGLFVLTSVLSQVVSNTATTVLIAPIAFQSAITLGVSPYTFMMTVAIAASTAFATPIASPVNTLVLGPGNYRFGDFSKLGIPLQILILVATLIVVPILFPL
ncbi:MAG TPA: SLC13 family permease [Caldilineae bacterium]|nr:SLC13 family permease [Caldilineae bacterium]